MKIYFKKRTQKSTRIFSFENWEKAFINVDKSHWQEGRSAHSLAFHFSNPSVEESHGLTKLRACLDQFGFKYVIFEEADIEHNSRFDSYRNGRKQDLFINARNGNKPLAICIEAKVDESFGEYLSTVQKNGEEYLKSHPGSNRLKRLKTLCDKFYMGKNIEELNIIRYQLLHYLAGSISEAKKMSGIAIMPVFVYKTNKYNDKIGEQNKDDYNNFMRSLGFKSIPSSDDSLLYKNEFDGTEVYSAYIEIDLK